MCGLEAGESTLARFGLIDPKRPPARHSTSDASRGDSFDLTVRMSPSTHERVPKRNSTTVELAQHGRKLAPLCRDDGIPVKQARSTIWGRANTYYEPRMEPNLQDYDPVSN